MYKVLWKLLVVFLLILGCSKGKKDLFLSEEDLVNMLVEVHVAEAAIQDLYGGIKDSVGQEYYHQIYERYDLSNEKFDSTMAILRRDPKFAGKIYGRVMKVIDEKQDEIRK